MTFSEKLKHYRITHDLTQEELARKLGTSKQVISRYENGQRSPKLSIAMQYAEKLGLSEQYLMNDKAELPLDNNRLFLTNVLPIPSMRKYPVLGKIACGAPIMAVENFEEYIDAPFDINADFVLQCQGDSMIEARIYDGDYVFVRHQREVENGEIAAVQIGDEVTLKRFYFYADSGMVILRPENRSYAEMTYKKDQLEAIRILGKAVKFLSDVK